MSKQQKASTPDQILRAKFGQGTASTVNAIVAVFGKATPAQIAAGAAWYPDMLAFALETLRLNGNVHTPEQAAAVIAHTSPRTSVKRNMDAAAAILGGSTDANPHGAMGEGVKRSHAALATDRPLDTVKGPKTAAFAANILGDTERVTIDVWMLRVAFGERADAEKLLGHKGVYGAVQYAFQVAARRVGVEPRVLQAVCWIVQRNGRAW